MLCNMWMSLIKFLITFIIHKFSKTLYNRHFWVDFIILYAVLILNVFKSLLFFDEKLFPDFIFPLLLQYLLHIRISIQRGIMQQLIWPNNVFVDGAIQIIIEIWIFRIFMIRYLLESNLILIIIVELENLLLMMLFNLSLIMKS